MKKLLLSIAAVACAASMSATSYTVFDNTNPTEWTGGAAGWTTTVKAGDQTFTITTAKESSTATDLVNPTKYPSWRVYKGSSVTIESGSFQMKQVIVTFDDYSNNQYVGEMTFSTGWAGELAGTEYTIVSTGLNNIKMSSMTKQLRVAKIVVSDEEGDIEPPVTPDLPEDVVYRNTFEENMDGWVKINDTALSDFNGWKINTSETAPKCAICNSYYGGANHAADAKMQYDFDLTDRENCTLSVEQAFGYDFPIAQVENYTLYVICNNETQELAFSNFPEIPASGNWSKSFAANEWDLSEFDGEKITIGFRYLTDGTKSRAWEIKNFVLKGDKVGAVSTVAEENAAAEYYTLQGVRTANPTSGLYIVVKGNKASKVIF
ncbi:MAG: hypothetical protein K2M87_02655 [Muribaculaceae bacterium]|nr:hypothetical protein [Muribaculaceae bacterium]